MSATTPPPGADQPGANQPGADQPASEPEAGRSAGPLHGLRVLEFESVGPGPYAALVLAGLGADVLRVRRPLRGAGRPAEFDPEPAALYRGRPSLPLDLRQPADRDTALRLVDRADVLIEGLRPGTMERLGLGPDTCLARNPRLVYGRMTGWGQDGPLAPRAGHDINFIALTGVLHSTARAGQPPVPPPTVAGDTGGGGMLLTIGVLAALLERGQSGRGQVIDAAMVDGSALLMSMVYALLADGKWRDQPGTNLIDTGAPFYDVYAAADGGYLAVGALEPRFYQQLLAGLELDPATLPDQYDQTGWPRLRQVFTEAFARRTRAEWTAVFEDLDACVTPVLSPREAPDHPQLRHRGTFTDHPGVPQPAPAPRFSRTPTAPPRYPDDAARRAALARWGVPDPPQ